MRTLFFVLMLYCTSASAQNFKDSSVVKMIEDLPSQEPFDTAHSYHKVTVPYVYIMSDNDVYRTFGYYAGVRYLEFNFADYHIFGEQRCRQCMQYCHHDEGQTNCHRNVCNREWVWAMRENKKAFAEVSSVTLPGHVEAKLPDGRRSFFGDTVITSSADSMTRWYTHGGGDCFARFTYTVVADQHNQALLLIERNFWGGCRAGGSWNFTISFKMPPGILHKRKNIILMEKYNN